MPKFRIGCDEQEGGESLDDGVDDIGDEHHPRWAQSVREHPTEEDE